MKQPTPRRYQHSALYREFINGSREWQRVRAEQLRRQPYCELCIKERRRGRPAATEVHHIREVDSTTNRDEARTLAYAPWNLMSLCSAHHRAIHDGRGYHTAAEQRKKSDQKAQQFLNRFITQPQPTADGATTETEDAGAVFISPDG